MLRNRIRCGWHFIGHPRPDIVPSNAAILSETKESELFFRECGRFPRASKIFHVPNGGGRTARQGAELKRAGTRPGVSDYLLLQRYAHGDVQYSGLALELKTTNIRSAPTPEQCAFLEELTEQGFAGVIAYGWHAALMAVTLYTQEGWGRSREFAPQPSSLVQSV